MFIERGYEGNIQFWRYLVSILLIVLAYILGQVPLTVVIALAAFNQNRLDTLKPDMDFTTLGIDNNLFLCLALIMFLLSMLCLILVVKYIHRKSIVSIVTARKRIDVGRIVYSAMLWLFLTILFELLSYMLSPEIYQFSFDWRAFIPLLFIVLIGIPIQAGFEEMFLRGYLMQAIGLIGIYRWVPLVVTSIIFGLLHRKLRNSVLV